MNQNMGSGALTVGSFVKFLGYKSPLSVLNPVCVEGKRYKVCSVHNNREHGFYITVLVDSAESPENRALKETLWTGEFEFTEKEASSRKKEEKVIDKEKKEEKPLLQTGDKAKVKHEEKVLVCSVGRTNSKKVELFYEEMGEQKRLVKEYPFKYKKI